MDGNKPSPIRRSVQTASGRITYMEQDTGPVALFVHGVLLNGHLWRHQLADLSDIRRCIAVDLLAHGDTEIAPDQDVSVTANAKMLKECFDALKIDQVDLVGNDSGGGIAQIFAALHLERVRSLPLTDCDTHDNWPPEAFKPFLAMAAAGGLRGTLAWGPRMNTRNRGVTTVSKHICARWSGPSSARATCNASSQPSTISTHSPLKHS